MFSIKKETHDPRGRIVFICKDANGFFVYKPGTGYNSRHWQDRSEPELQAAFLHQESCGHNNPFYNNGHQPQPGEVYPDFEKVWQIHANVQDADLPETTVLVIPEAGNNGNISDSEFYEPLHGDAKDLQADAVVDEYKPITAEEALEDAKAALEQNSAGNGTNKQESVQKNTDAVIKPAKPVKQPAKRVKSAKPQAKPVKPVKPAKPVKKPAKPAVKPVKPAKPAKPAKPVKKPAKKGC